MDNSVKYSWDVISDIVKGAAFVLYLCTWLKEDESIEDMDNDSILSLKEKWNKYWVPSLKEEHCGDCTKIPATCTRCCMEEFIQTAERITQYL